MRAIPASMAALLVTACTETVPVLESLVPADQGPLTGTLIGDAEGDTLRAAVLWNHYEDATFAEELAAESPPLGTLPAPFSIDVAPPAEAILRGAVIEGGGARFGYGLIVALREGDMASPYERIAGAARDHVIVYADDDMDPQTETGRLLHGRLAKGLHLMQVNHAVSGCFGEEGATRCYPFLIEPAPSGLSTEVEISADPAAFVALPLL